ncbi:MAG: ATP-binding protein [Bacteroidota bacterium]|nr:ATP-binding protein [Bacteroidota bacterium]
MNKDPKVKQSWWSSYAALVYWNCAGASGELSGLESWRNKLFAAIMTYLLPLSFVAVIPGVIMSFVGGAVPLAIADILILFLIAFIGLFPGLSISLRKTFFIILLYLTSGILLYFLGSFGPGLLYLLAVTIFIILILPQSYAFWSVGINLIVCTTFGFAVHYNVIDHTLVPLYSVGSWIAISSNVILLSSVMAVLLPMLFNGLQKTIDEQRRLDDQLLKEQKALIISLDKVKYKNNELEQFAYIASHDLQEPLRSLSGLITLLKKKLEQDQGNQEIMNHIQVSSDRMRMLVTGLLEYARIGMEKTMAITDCNKIVAEVKEDLRTLIHESNAAVKVGALPVFNAYASEMKQLFQNLVTNAIKFRKSGIDPEIEIGATISAEETVFFVKDNGIGIDAQFREKIFVIFQRLHTRSEYEGTGIGLAYCRKIVELHNGKIWVESKEGEGAVFYFSMPCNTE